MNSNLYDIQGYEIRFEMGKTYNPKAEGANGDTRDLGVLLCYLGANIPECEELSFENDEYVMSRMEFPFQGEWNYHAFRDFWGPEENGTWLQPVSRAFLKDSGITNSGLKFVYYVPEWIAKLQTTLTVTINDDLVFTIPLNEEGMFTQVWDVSEAGYEVVQYLDQTHRILKILISEFDRVCKKYQLNYYLICGSLIGAVRHQDIIPWDDDVDVAMPREDYEKLLLHVDEEWGAGRDIQFVNYDQMGKDTFLDYMTRIVYMKEEVPVNVFRKIQGKGRSDIGNHLPMDIYVLDNASDVEWIHKLQTGIITGLYGLAMGHRAYVKESDYANRDQKTQRIVKVLSNVGRCIPLPFIFRCYEWVRKWNKNKNTENYYESNGFIYCIPWKFKKSWFGNGVQLKLGEVTVQAPQEYQEFLKMHYGNYEKYPYYHLRKPTHSEEASGIF